MVMLSPDALQYEAGSTRRLAYRMTFDIWKAQFSQQKSDLVTRFIEFWCQQNCHAAWRVEETSRTIIVYFESTRDYVIFKISREYNFLS